MRSGAAAAGIGEREAIRQHDIEIRPLTAAMKDEYIAYFDGPAFADNPVWAQCYCLSYHMPQGTGRWPAFGAEP